MSIDIIIGIVEIVIVLVLFRYAIWLFFSVKGIQIDIKQLELRMKHLDRLFVESVIALGRDDKGGEEK